MLNLIERTVCYRLAELSFDIPKYFYARRDLTWAFTWVRETKSHRIRVSRRIRFKSKIRENSFQNFDLGLNRGAK